MKVKIFVPIILFNNLFLTLSSLLEKIDFLAIRRRWVSLFL